MFVPDKGLTEFQIWLLAWGVSLLVLLVVMTVLCCWLRRRRLRRERNQEQRRISLHDVMEEMVEVRVWLWLGGGGMVLPGGDWLC